MSPRPPVGKRRGDRRRSTPSRDESLLPDENEEVQGASRQQGRVLGVDSGSRRIGLALSDPLGCIASPYQVLVIRKLAEAVDQILQIVKEQEVRLIVVGLPLRLSGEAGESASQARELTDRLRVQAAIPVEEWDERLTSVGASRAMRQAGVKEEKQRGRVDMVAAALILQSYLDGHR